MNYDNDHLSSFVYVLCQMMCENINNLKRYGYDPTRAAIHFRVWSENTQQQLGAPVTHDMIKQLKAMQVIQFVSPSYLVPTKSDTTKQLYKLAKLNKLSGSESNKRAILEA